jgi:hypothetical protein
MGKIRTWTLDTAAYRLIEVTLDLCEGGGPASKNCPNHPDFTLSWTYNESGLPGLGSSRTAFVCRNHLAERMSHIKFKYCGAVLVTEYRQIPD